MNPQMFVALAEPHRLEIVELLLRKSRPVNEIVQKLHLHQPQVSKHLKVLADAGLVEVTPIAQQRYYQLRPQPFKELERWLNQYLRLWEERFERLDALFREEKTLRKNKGGEK